MVIMVIDMKVNGEMIKKKEKEFFIGMLTHGKVIDMKVILEMVILKEKEFIIFLMEIEEWVII